MSAAFIPLCLVENTFLLLGLATDKSHDPPELVFPGTGDDCILLAPSLSVREPPGNTTRGSALVSGNFVL